MPKSTIGRREKHHLFVTDKRDCEAICNEVVDSLNEFLRQRFSIDDVVISNLVSFTHFHADVDLHAVHESIASDMDVAALPLEFHELAARVELASMSLPDVVKCLAKSDEYPTMLTALSRILAAKPHSADVERCISANNLLKTSLRSALKLSTESMYLFIYSNLPPTAEWNLRPAVLSWLMKKERRHTVPKKNTQQFYFRNFSTMTAKLMIPIVANPM